jgi:uncharacterized membrane protein
LKGPLASVGTPLAAFPLPRAQVGQNVAAMQRISSLDIIRGIVCVLMAIDHVRVYSGQPAGGPTAGIFFTRWITHFCAPVFVFLAGSGAFLYGHRLKDRGKLARYLVTRGLMLVVLELTVIRFSWTFNLDYANFTLAGVIWMIGWCMVLLAGLVWLSTRTIGIIGLAVMALQQLFAFVPIAPAFWNFIYPRGADGWSRIEILYVLVPWIGVMAAGYAFGAVMLRDAGARRRFCLRAGGAATALFAVYVAAFMIFAPAGTDPDSGPKLFQALNPPKYPASQPFLLMTLGPMLLLVPFLENARGWLAGAFRTIGRVPLFYYLLHIPLIHVTALAVWYLRDGTTHADWFATAPYVYVEPQNMWSLSLLYLVFAIDVGLLYVCCKWYESRKR